MQAAAKQVPFWTSDIVALGNQEQPLGPILLLRKSRKVLGSLSWFSDLPVIGWWPHILFVRVLTVKRHKEDPGWKLLGFAQLKATHWHFPGGPVIKNPPANAWDTGLSLVWEDTTYLGATKPEQHKYWACALKLVLCNKSSYSSEKPA